MAPTTDDDRTSRTKDDIRQWPWQAQFAALLFALAIAAFLIVLPVLVVRVLDAEYAFSSESDLWAAMIAILLGLTTMTVSGVFVFMTFRIDRGARLEAQKTAEKEAKKAMEKYGKGVVDNLKKELKDQFTESKQKINELYSNVQKDVSDVAEKTTEKVTNVAENATKEVSRVAEKTTTEVSQLTDTVQKNVSEIANSVKEMENQVAESNQRITDKFDDGMREIDALFAAAQENAQAAIDNADEAPDDDGAEDPNNE